MAFHKILLSTNIVDLIPYSCAGIRIITLNYNTAIVPAAALRRHALVRVHCDHFADYNIEMIMTTHIQIRFSANTAFVYLSYVRRV